jgi:hypothetical protein
MDKQTKRLKDIARQVRYIDQYTDDIQTDTDCDQIEALTESIGCISYIIDVLQQIIKDIITDKDIKKIREEQQEQISIQAKDPWEEYLKGDFNGAIKIKQDTDHEKE